MARATPEEFVREVLVDSLRAKWVIVGIQLHIRMEGSGNAETLKDLGEKYGFHVEVSKPVSVGGAVVSSTRIRSSLAKGDVESASQMLGGRFPLRER